MKSLLRILVTVCVLAILATSAKASVSESNNTPGYIKKVVMRSLVHCGSCYQANFTCEHYLNYGESMNYNDFATWSGDCHCNYYYSVESITWIQVGGDVWSTGGIADFYYQRHGASQFDMNLWWSPGAHDALLGHALGGRATPNAIDALRRSSREFDKKTQSTADSHKHSMRRGGQTVGEAITERDDFIRDTIAEARVAALAGNHEEALRLLGEALHPVMDYSSPMHSDADGNPKIWRGLIRDGWGHSPNDLVGNERTQDITEEVYEFQDRIILSYFVTVFRGTPVTVTVFETGFNPDQVVINVVLPHN